MFSIKKIALFVIVLSAMLSNQSFAKIHFIHNNQDYINYVKSGFDQIRSRSDLFNKLYNEVDNSGKDVYVVVVDQYNAVLFGLQGNTQAAAYPSAYTSKEFGTVDSQYAQNPQALQYLQQLQSISGHPWLMVKTIKMRGTDEILYSNMIAHELFHVYQDIISPIDIDDAYRTKLNEVEAYSFELVFNIIENNSDPAYVALNNIGNIIYLKDHLKTGCALGDQDRVLLDAALKEMWQKIASFGTIYQKVNQNTRRDVKFDDLTILRNFMQN